MGTLEINDAIFNELVQRATAEGCSTDALLERFLTPCATALRDDITRLQIEKELQDSRHNVQALIENAPGDMWSMDKEYRLITANSAFKKRFAIATGHEPLRGHDFMALALPADLLAEWRNYYDRALNGEKFLVETSTHFTTPVREIEYRFNPIWSDNGTILGVAVFSLDITERKQAEAQIQRTEATLRAMLNSTWQSFILIDRNRRIMEIDGKGKRAGEALFGKALHLGDSIYDFIMPRDLDGFNTNFERALNGETIMLEKEILGAHNTHFYFEFVYYPVIDQNGQIIGVCMSNQDITKRKVAEERLRQSEENYRLLAENVTDLISKHTLEGVYTFVTPSAETLLGYTPDDLIGHSAYEFYHPVDLEIIQQARRSVVEQPLISTITYRLRRKDGQYIWCETTTHMICDAETNEPREIVAVSRDITARKRAEEKLYQSEARLLSLLDTQTAFVVRCDLEGHYTYVNQAFADRYKWFTHDLLGHSLMETVIPLDHEKTIAAASACLAEPGKVVQVTLRKATPDDQHFWTLWEFVALQGNDDTPTEIQCIGFDITEQIKAEHLGLEQERLSASLKKEQEFNTLVQRAVSALSHDIRTPLSLIATSRDLLSRYFDRLDEAKRREKLETIDQQLHYVVLLLNDLSLTVKGTLDDRHFQPTWVNLATLCEISIAALQQSVGSQHRLNFSNDGEIGSVWIDETLVSRILLNLLSNALKFSLDGEPIEVRLSRQENWIFLHVVDHGLGIDEREQAHIFEPFYRSQAVSAINGTGLGLNIVKNCVERHHGHISMKSQLGKGTTFTVELPLLKG